MRGVILAPLFLLFLSLTASSQVQVMSEDGMIQERFVKAGESYFVKFFVINSTEKDTEILIVKRDLILDRGRTIFKDAGTLERSNAHWIKVKNPRLLLKKKRKAELKFLVTVPKDAESGSYHSVICVQTNPHVVAIESNRKMLIHPRIAFQIITTIEGGISKAKIVKAEVKENLLNLDIENTGTNMIILKLRPDDENIESRKVLVYPSQTQTTKLKCDELRDGKHRIRFILDDGKFMLIPQWIEFEKGELEKVREARLAHLKGEKIKKRRRATKPFNLYLALNYGDRSKGLNLVGNVRAGNFSLNAGSSFTEYRLTDYDYSSYRILANYRIDKFRFGAGTYLYGDRWVTAFRASVSLKYTQMGISFLKESKSLGVNISQRLFKRYRINFHGFKSPYRQSWNFSLMIPIF